MKSILLGLATLLVAQFASAQAKVMNPGEAYGQLVFLSEADVTKPTDKYTNMTPLAIPVFEELPVEMSVVAGAMTLKQQTLLSHIQLKSRARHTPNLDISGLAGGMSNPLFQQYKEGDWIHMLLGEDGSILIEPSTEDKANQFYASKNMDPIQLKADLSATKVMRSEDMTYQDAIRVGTKSANYAELMIALNTADRTIVRPGFGIPFYFYQDFVDSNPKVKAAIDGIIRDPLMSKVAKVSYRQAKLKALQDLMTSTDAVVNEALVQDLLTRLNAVRMNNLPRKWKLRSSSNSEDLPNFNGAGLYDSDGYNGTDKKGAEKSAADKEKDLKKTLQYVWASVWNLRAYDERAYFRIAHQDVKMGIQVNLAFANEGADGVVVSKNAARDPNFPGEGVYLEVLRGSKYSVTNPTPNVKPEKVLVNYDKADPLNVAAYKISFIQRSNIGDDSKTILPNDNPNPVMTDDELKDLALQVMKAHLHFKPLIGADKDDFALDLEFKVDSEDTGTRKVYLKQARSYID